jgi:hypothetical protein
MTLYWVGGTDNWNGTAGTKWSLVSGGVGGAVIPTAADEVVFDANSGAVTVTITTSQPCRSLDCTGFTGTLVHSSSVTVSIGDATAGTGNIALKLVAGMTYTASQPSSTFAYVSTSATQQTIDTAGKSMGAMTISGAGGSWILASSFTGTSPSFTLTRGSFDTGNFNMDVGTLSSDNSNTRSLTLGSSTVTILGSSATPWTLATTTGLTFSPGTSTVRINALGTTMQTGGLTYATVIFRGTSASIGNQTIAGGGTFADISVVPTFATDLTFVVSNNITITGTFTVTGRTTGTTQGKVNIIRTNPSNNIQTTITAAAVALTDANFMDITAAGAAIPFTGTRVGNGGGNSDITFDATRTLYWVGNGGSWNDKSRWSTSSGGASGADIPMPQDTVVIDAASFSSASQSIAFNTLFAGGDIDFTALDQNITLTFSVTGVHYCGSLTLSNRISITAGGTVVLAGRGTHTLNPAGAGITGTAFTINVACGSYTQAANLSITGSLNLFFGSYDANDFNVTCTTFASNNSNTRSLDMGAGTWSFITTATATIFNISSTISLVANLATIAITTASANTRTIQLAGFTYGTITYTVAGSTGILSILTSVTPCTIGTLNFSDATNARTLRFQNNRTFNIDVFNVTGAAGRVVTIDSASAGTAATLSKASGVVALSDYLSIRDSTATGGADWYAGANSTSVSNVSGWIFATYDAMLTIDDALLGLSADSLDMNQDLWLSIADAFMDLSSESLLFPVDTPLTIADAIIALTSGSPIIAPDDSVSLTVGSGSNGRTLRGSVGSVILENEVT